MCLSMCVSFCSDYNFWPDKVGISFLVCRYITTYLGQFWVSRSLSQGQCQLCFAILYLTFNFVCLYSSQTWLKCQSYLKVKVMIFQYQSKMLKNHFYVLDCKCFCDLLYICYADGTPLTQRDSYILKSSCGWNNHTISIWYFTVLLFLSACL